jgi:pyruvate,water dikinase
MNHHVLGFADLDRTTLARVGGKGANLGELSRIPGISVPDGFCVTTEAFARIRGDIPSMRERLDRLSGLQADQRDELRAQSAEIRRELEAAVVPEDMRDEIRRAVARLGEDSAYAVRSSATAEDLPTASFAGQQDTYLNVIGTDEIVRHVRRCWASLYTERAVTYRIRNGFDHRSVRLAVVVQKMVFPAVAGILFTADPISSHRKVSSIDASFGLGEAVVSGRVTPDVYRVRAGAIVDKKVSAKSLAVVAQAGGGTREQPISAEQQQRQALTDEQIVRLERIGRTIEAHFERPQDIEWCLVDDTFYVVQSRAITTLFPLPQRADRVNRVYISVGHQQMMTDAMKPLGLSVFQLAAMSPMVAAGGRLFVDVTERLASPARNNMLDVIGPSLVRDALVTVIERGDFLPEVPVDNRPPMKIRSHKGLSAADLAATVSKQPQLVSSLVEVSARAVTELAATIQTLSGPALFDFIVEDIGRMKQLLTEPRNMAAIMAGINASAWINEHVNAWLGDKNAADTVARTLPPNTTSEMGLALLDVADVIRPYPAVVDYLRQVTGERFLDGLSAIEGGPEARDAIVAFLDTYGMRCAGEIDVTRDRWSEKPSTLIPVLLGNVKNVAQGVGRASFVQRREEALVQEHDLLERLRALPDGEQRAADTEQMIALVREFMGYREYPKYHIVSRFFVYKQALLREADALVRANVIRAREDIYFLTFDELHEVVRTQHLDGALLEQRRDEHRAFSRLTPPNVFTSDGEVVAGSYRRHDVPAGALVGVAASSGVIEGRARVVLRMEEADLGEDDILVTAFTDPSWTPLFVTIKGLITEVGGLMTHGAVIAREYGLPAVVAVEHVTTRIRDGQRIRLNGTDGYIELL